MKENYDLNISNKEDLINELNILKSEIISKKNILQEKDKKILILIKNNEKLSQNVEIINNKLKNILNKKLKEQSIKNKNYVFTESNDKIKKVQILEQENKIKIFYDFIQ